MSRTLIGLAALAATTLSLGLAPAPARAQVRAVPVTAVAKTGPTVAGDTLWNCGPDGCTTRALTARPVVACAQMTKKIGAVTSFTVGGAALSPDDLAKCNAKAKGGAALARN